MQETVKVYEIIKNSFVKSEIITVFFIKIISPISI